MVEEREDREPEDLEADDDGDGPVDPLDPGLGVVERAGGTGRGTAASPGSRGPESVARTMTPIVTSRSAVATVAAASFWKRVTSLLRVDSGLGRTPAPAPARRPAPVAAAV